MLLILPWCIAFYPSCHCICFICLLLLSSLSMSLAVFMLLILPWCIAFTYFAIVYVLSVCSFYLPFLCLSHFLSTVIFIESFTTLLSMFCGQIYIMRITFYQIVENRIFCDYFTLHFYILWIIIVHMLVQLLCTFIPLILLRHSVDLLPKFSFRSLSQCLSLYLYYLRFF